MNKITIYAHQIEKNVKQSALLLDEERPGWHDDIRLDSLIMHSTAHCICGQLDLIGDNPDPPEMEPVEGIEYSYTRGFFIPFRMKIRGMDSEETWQLLTDIWKNEVIERQLKNN